MPSKTNGILFSQLENYVNSSFISESKFNLIYNYIDSQRYFLSGNYIFRSDYRYSDYFYLKTIQKPISK